MSLSRRVINRQMCVYRPFPFLSFPLHLSEQCKCQCQNTEEFDKCNNIPEVRTHDTAEEEEMGELEGGTYLIHVK